MINSPIISSNYTINPNELLTAKLSHTAKLTWILLKSKGQGWNVYISVLARELDVSITTLRKHINELIENGWLSRTERRNRSGQLMGGHDYCLLIPNEYKNLSPKTVDNSAPPEQQFAPDEQFLPPNNNKIKSNKEKNNNIGVGSKVVVNNSNFSELELQAANQYVDSQRGIRDRDAYLACTLRNGWHRQLYQTLHDKITKNERQNKINSLKATFRDNKDKIKNKISQKLEQINGIGAESIIDQLAKLTKQSNTIWLHQCADRIAWYYCICESHPNLVEKPEIMTDYDVAAFRIVRQLSRGIYA